MKTSRNVVIGIAAIAALLLAFLVRGLVAGKPSTDASAVNAPVSVQQPTVRVLVAARDIRAGTRLSAEDLNWQDWPQNLVNPLYVVDPASQPNGAVAGSEGQASSDTTNKVGDAVEKAVDVAVNGTTMDQYVGGVAREDILASEPIVDSKIVRAEEGGFLAIMIKPGMRAMSIPVSVESTAGGFILPGDHVDILATHQLQRQGGGTYDTVTPVLANVRVLAIDQAIKTEADKPNVIGATATIEVTPQQAQALTLAKASGSLSLMLRSYADVSGPSSILSSRPAGAPASEATVSEGQTVRVYRNGQASEVTVSR